MFTLTWLLILIGVCVLIFGLILYGAYALGRTHEKRKLDEKRARYRELRRKYEEESNARISRALKNLRKQPEYDYAAVIYGEDHTQELITPTKSSRTVVEAC